MNHLVLIAKHKRHTTIMVHKTWSPGENDNAIESCVILYIHIMSLGFGGSHHRKIRSL